MQISWGGYNHPSDSVKFRISLAPIENSFKQGRGHRATWMMQGRLKGTDVTDLSAKMQVLEDAYAVNNKDLIIRDGLGAQTPHSLLNSNTTGGTRVKDFTWLDGNPQLPRAIGSGAEYVFERNYSVEVTADVLIRGGGMHHFEEKVIYLGNGGPHTEIIELATGTPDSQVLRDQTKLTVIQSGYLVGDSSFLDPPAYLFSGVFYDQKRSRVELATPKFVSVGSGSAYDYVTSWSYVFNLPGSSYFWTQNPTMINV